MIEFSNRVFALFFNQEINSKETFINLNKENLGNNSFNSKNLEILSQREYDEDTKNKDYLISINSQIISIFFIFLIIFFSGSKSNRNGKIK